MVNKENYFKKAWSLTLGMAIGVLSVAALPVTAAPLTLQEPVLPVTTEKPEPAEYQADTLLLMVAPGADRDEIKKDLEEVHGQIVGGLSGSGMEILIVKTEKGKLNETEKKLNTKKNDFSLIQRNHRYKASFVPNDPQYRNQWHLPVIRAQQAWDISRGGVWVAVFDSGCQPNKELQTDRGYDAMDRRAYENAKKGTYAGKGEIWKELPNPGGLGDPHGHGTWVASTVSATANNHIEGAGVAPSSSVYPVKMSSLPDMNGDVFSDDIGIVAGYMKCWNLIERVSAKRYGGPDNKNFLEEAVDDVKDAIGIGKRKKHWDEYFKYIRANEAPKIINISYDLMPDFDKNKLLQNLFKRHYDLYGGLTFISAGNGIKDKAGVGHGFQLKTKTYPYIACISAIDRTLKRAEFSNFGNCVTLTAPGDDIQISDRNGGTAVVSGTSFSAPICAGVAALVWAANPNLSNHQVMDILKRTASRPASGNFSQAYGYGVVNAEAAVKAARGS
jgi:subtilisin family serine protease